MIVKFNGSFITNFEENAQENKKRIKELNTITLTIIRDTYDEAYAPDLEVEITTNDSIVLKYITSEDNFFKTSNSPLQYTHELILVEPTKLLEGITMSNHTFKNKVNGVIGDGVTYTVWDQLQRIRNIANIETTALLATTRKFDFSTAIIPSIGMNIQAYTETKLAPQITKNRPNARQALDEILAYIDAEVVMYDFTNVSIIFYNDTKNSIDTSDLINYRGKQSGVLEAQAFDMFLENSISEANVNKQAIVYPSRTAWGSVRANGSYLTSDSFLMEVQEGIDEVLKFEVYAEIESTIPPGVTENEIISVDITELLLEKSAWESLLYDLPNYWDAPVRNNTVFYTRGDTKILGFHEKLDVFAGVVGVVFSYQHLLSYAATKLAGGAVTDRRANTTLDDFENFMFRLTYVPKMSERLRVEKDYPTSDKALFFNQTENIPDIEKQGRKARGELKRIGNKELRITKVVDNYADTIEDGDYVIVNGNKYIAIDVSNSIGKVKIISEALMSKDYANISRRVSINNETRSSEIDGGKGAITRQELYNEYVELSYGTLANDSFVTADGKFRLMELFDNGVPLTDIPVELCQFTPSPGLPLIVSCKSVGTANVIKFDFGFDSVNIAGNATVKTDGVWINSFVTYADGDARFDTMSFKLIGGYEPNVDTFTNHIALAQNLPNRDQPNTTITKEYIVSPSINIEKDGGEIFKFTYQLTFRDGTAGRDIIIGPKLASENPLVVVNTETLYYYKRSTRFTDNNFITKYDEKLLIINGGTPAIDEIVLTWDSDKINVARVSDHYWAIGNDDGDLYFAVNNEQANIIYFNPRNKRSEN